MKTTAMIVSIFTLFTFNVLGQSSDVQALLKNMEMRKEVFSNILNDHNLMMEFMDQMSGNTHAMAMMRGNHQMMMQRMHQEGMIESDLQQMGHSAELYE